ncbi:MAG: prepilin-type N-terminal cleavage/methylation domain-containing protein [Thermodesulfovibrionales bacterium]
MMRSKDNKGLTLLEVLIAIAISSVIMLTLYVTISNTVKVISSNDERLNGFREISIIADSIRREVETAVFDSQDESTAFFLVQRDYYGRPLGEITFVGLPSTSKGLYVIHYKAQESENKVRLLKKVYRIGSPPDKARWEVVMDEVYSFSVLAYDGKETLKIWDSSIKKTPPREVRIELQIKPSEGDGIISVSERATLRLNTTL